MTRHADRDAGNRFTPAPAPDVDIPHVAWDTFMADHFVWRQGEHVTMVGPTGSGKTTAAMAILPQRSFVLALAMKPKDDTMNALIKSAGYLKVKDWKAIPAIRLRKVLRAVLWPRYRSVRDVGNQAVVFDEALDNAFIAGGWCLYVDELFWAAKLGLNPQLEAWWTQGRSNNLTVIAGTQRPAHISLLAYDQATHLFFWRDNDEANLKRISGLNGSSAKLVKYVVSNLARHDTLYVNTRTGAMVVTRAPRD